MAKQPNRFQQVIRICLCLIVLFVSINILVFTKTISHQTIKDPYVGATAYMAAAQTINSMYIFPLSKNFGYKNSMTIPFYSLRDFLYNKGYALFPESAGEKEMWWGIVRYSEFDKFVFYEAIKYYKGDKNIDLKYLIEWTDEIYSHLYPFATKPLKNEYFKTKRLQMYTLISYWYIRARCKILADLDNKYSYPFENKHEEIERFKNILEWFDTLKNNAKLNENKAYESYAQRTTPYWFHEFDLKLEASMLIVYYDLFEESFDCNSPYLKTYLSSRNILYNAMDDPIMLSKSKNNILQQLSEGQHSFFYQTMKTTCKINL